MFITFLLLMEIFQILFYTQHYSFTAFSRETWKFAGNASEREAEILGRGILLENSSFHEDNVNKSSVYFLPNDDLFTFLLLLTYIYFALCSSSSAIRAIKWIRALQYYNNVNVIRKFIRCECEQRSDSCGELPIILESFFAWRNVAKVNKAIMLRKGQWLLWVIY